MTYFQKEKQKKGGRKKGRDDYLKNARTTELKGFLTEIECKKVQNTLECQFLSVF